MEGNKNLEELTVHSMFDYMSKHMKNFYDAIIIDAVLSFDSLTVKIEPPLLNNEECYVSIQNLSKYKYTLRFPVKDRNIAIEKIKQTDYFL